MYNKMQNSELRISLLSQRYFHVPRKQRKLSGIVKVLFRLMALEVTENSGSPASLQRKGNRTQIHLQESSIINISLILEHCIRALGLARVQGD